MRDRPNPIQIGNVSGSTLPDYGSGMLPAEWYTVVSAAITSGRMRYVVESYRTPIAFAYESASGDVRWVTPPVRYSVTTTNHQTVMHGAIVRATGAAPLTDPVAAVLDIRPDRPALAQADYPHTCGVQLLRLGRHERRRYREQERQPCITVRHRRVWSQRSKHSGAARLEGSVDLVAASRHERVECLVG